ncbi:succinate dehydrogenase cytochrome b subunit [Corynebacterium caspium]|uniref:succinate dehydrogenase cytochrome b subunit n=1 Tax=Corynebacterium caspium TaxID=234828 RepID=UPI000364678F|nr:succinate dehydrogenase cytochrome b subunit [Corynebacterium caspium]WKD59934.1 Succinate dehydrogenase/Fumarate reductase transmembrane subunit [Corynebacterium caspium DSM 44850]
MTVRNPDREAIRHGKITEEPIRPQRGMPAWAIKLGMAITGLMFGGFLVAHMVGNLKIYLPDHGDTPAIDEYGHFLRELGTPLFPEESILWFLRIILLAALIFHIYGAFALHGRSRNFRGKFRRTDLMGGLNSFATRTMLVTGLVLLAFIIFHILDLTMGVQPAAPETFAHGEIYNNMLATFSRWPVTIWYMVAMLAMFLHLTHGIVLACSDLGITGHRTRAAITAIAYALPAIVLVGNIIMPLSIALGWLS